MDILSSVSSPLVSSVSASSSAVALVSSSLSEEKKINNLDDNIEEKTLSKNKKRKERAKRQKQKRRDAGGSNTDDYSSVEKKFEAARVIAKRMFDKINVLQKEPEWDNMTDKEQYNTLYRSSNESKMFMDNFPIVSSYMLMNNQYSTAAMKKLIYTEHQLHKELESDCKTNPLLIEAIRKKNSKNNGDESWNKGRNIRVAELQDSTIIDESNQGADVTINGKVQNKIISTPTITTEIPIDDTALLDRQITKDNARVPDDPIEKRLQDIWIESRLEYSMMLVRRIRKSKGLPISMQDLGKERYQAEKVMRKDKVYWDYLEAQVNLKVDKIRANSCRKEIIYTIQRVKKDPSILKTLSDYEKRVMMCVLNGESIPDREDYD
jgi:hypothetical protein